MSSRRSLQKPRYAELARTVPTKLRPPFGIALGSPVEVAELAASLPEGEIVCYQMDLFQANRLRDELAARRRPAQVFAAPDLWDLSTPVETLLFPVPLGGERQLKLDMLDQGYHVLRPTGSMIVLSPYEKDAFFPAALKKIFGRVHSPMAGKNKVLWGQRSKDRPRRRHEVVFQVNAGEGNSLRFVSRPGVFSFGRFDDGARALVETMDIREGDRVLDMGCGAGTNGIFAARRSGPTGATVFLDSNLRALALAELNARNLGVENFQTLASSTMTELEPATFDVVLANPPYYAQLNIARLFIERAHVLLKPHGRLFLVTKQPDILGPEVADKFGPTEAAERRGYVILCAGKEA